MLDGASGSLPIIYRDDSLIAIHKPAGLLVHRSVLDRQCRRTTRANPTVGWHLQAGLAEDFAEVIGRLGWSG